MGLLPEQCRAARGLLNWTQDHLAILAGVSRSTIKGFECQRRLLHRATEAQLVRALEEAGVCLLSSGRHGPGVRLRKPDAAARQMAMPELTEAAGATSGLADA